MQEPLRIIPLADSGHLEDFIDLPWRLYRGDLNWIPPLRAEIRAIVEGRGNPLAHSGPRRFFVAYRGSAPVGRIGAGVNASLNQRKGTNYGYITLFESEPDEKTAVALFDDAFAWLREQGVAAVRGPVSPTNGDDYRGLLVRGFDSAPVLMDSYNPPAYVEYFEHYGFFKHLDLYAYYYDLTRPIPQAMEKAVAYAMRRYGFRADPLHLDDLEREIQDIHSVIERAMPEEWDNLVPPTVDELRKTARQMAQLADPSIIRIARTHSGEPIGFGLAMPDMNQVLARLNGRLSIWNLIPVLYWRKHITGVRFFVLFVVPEFRNKGVTGAIFLEGLKAARKRGYLYCEGSTIGEINMPMRRAAEGAGGVHYKTYRIYERPV